MTIIDALILGSIEGITEFLPISSTGHLIIANKFLENSGEFIKTFEITIQFGAILAVVFLYRKILIKNLEVWKKILIAFLPTAVLGIIFYKLVKILLDSVQVVVWSLFIGGIIIILFEKWYNRNKNNKDNDLETISYIKAFKIGLFQAIAMIPGISRSGATIIGGLFLGLNRKTIVEFSFLLAIPTMLAASSLELVKNFKLFSSSDWNLLAIGFLTSFLVAILTIKFLLKYIQKNNFAIFGIYRIIIAIIFWKLII